MPPLAAIPPADVPLPFLLKLVPEPEKADAFALLNAAATVGEHVKAFDMAVRLCDIGSRRSEARQLRNIQKFICRNTLQAR
jgi:hypothetical protein